MAARILYVNPFPDCRVETMTLAGVRRYAGVRGWAVEAVRSEALSAGRLPALLRTIRRNVARLGAGRIVYSTCSIDRAENEGVVSAFTEKAACGYVVEKSRTWLPIADLPDFDRFLPPTWHDGAFAALLRRV